MNSLSEFARQYIEGAFKAQGYMMPCVIALDCMDQLHLIEIQGMAPEMKEQLAQYLRRVFKEKKVKAYAFISEAWTLKINSKTRPILQVPIREDDRRIESVICVVEKAGEEKVDHMSWRIDRTGDPKLINYECFPSVNNDGIFSNLLEGSDEHSGTTQHLNA